MIGWLHRGLVVTPVIATHDQEVVGEMQRGDFVQMRWMRRTGSGGRGAVAMLLLNDSIFPAQLAGVDGGPPGSSRQYLTKRCRSRDSPRPPSYPTTRLSTTTTSTRSIGYPKPTSPRPAGPPSLPHFHSYPALFPLPCKYRRHSSTLTPSNLAGICLFAAQLDVHAHLPSLLLLVNLTSPWLARPVRVPATTTAYPRRVQPHCSSCATGGTTLLPLSTQRHHRVSGPIAALRAPAGSKKITTRPPATPRPCS